VQSLSEYGNSGKIPGSLERFSPFGPLEMPPETSGIAGVRLDQVIALANLSREAILDTGILPSQHMIEGKKVGTGSLLALFCMAYLDVLKKAPTGTYQILPFDPYPTENAETIIAEVESYKHWPVHRPDLDMARLVEFTKLQLWTMKPAHER